MGIYFSRFGGSESVRKKNHPQRVHLRSMLGLHHKHYETNEKHNGIIRLRQRSLFDIEHQIDSKSDGESNIPPYGQIGLNNLGNTCFLNSAVQCLSNTIPLTDFFLGEKRWKRKHINKTNPMGMKGEIALAYGKLIQKLWSGKALNSISPKELKDKIGQWSPKFRGNEQHDSQELLAFLLDGLHEDLNRVKKKEYYEIPDCDGKNHEEAAAEAWKAYLMRNKSIIVDLFQGQLRSTLQCLECNHQSVTFDPFMHLSLPLMQKSGTQSTIQDLMSYFTKEEKLTGEERWICPKCKKLVDTTKKIEFWKFPPCLIIHLKRFKNDPNGSRSKVDTLVEFPIENLNFNEQMASKQKDEPIYNLYAVSNHHGTINGGHYTAYSKNRNSDHWYLYNDNVCTLVEDMNSIISHDAYVLFYKRKSILKHGYRQQSLSQPDLWPHTLDADPDDGDSQTDRESDGNLANETKRQHSMSLDDNMLRDKSIECNTNNMETEDVDSDDYIKIDSDEDMDHDVDSVPNECKNDLVVKEEKTILMKDEVDNELKTIAQNALLEDNDSTEPMEPKKTGSD